MQTITRTISADKLAEVMELPKSLLGHKVLVTIDARDARDARSARKSAADAEEKADDTGDWEGEVPNAETLEAMEDVRLRRNLYGPFDTAAEAVASMLAD